jgi:hypothetical protein
MSEQDPAALAAKAAKDARKMMVLTMFAVAVAILVLAIDNSIKRSIITEAQKIRGMVGRFEEVAGGFTAAEQGGAGDSAADGAADVDGGGVADASGARAAAAGNAAGGEPAGRGRAGGRKPGP